MASGFLQQAASADVIDEIHARVNHEIGMWNKARAVMAGLRLNPEEAKPSKQNPGM